MSVLKSLKRYKPWIGLVMALLILGSLMQDMLNDDLLSKLKNVSNLWMILFLAPLTIFCKALSWHQLTIGLSIALKPLQTFEAYALSNLGRYIPGKVFFVLGRIQAYGPDKQKMGTASFGMFMDFIIDLSSNFFILVLCCLLTPYLSEYQFILIPTALIALAICITPNTYQFLYRHLHKWFPTWVSATQIPWNIALKPLCLILLNWVCFIGCIYIFIQAWQPINPTDGTYIAVCLGFSSIIGTLAIISPGGLGVREGLFTACLLSLGLNAEDAWTIATLTRVCQWYGELVFSLIALALSGLIKPKEVF